MHIIFLGGLERNFSFYLVKLRNFCALKGKYDSKIRGRAKRKAWFWARIYTCCSNEVHTSVDDFLCAIALAVDSGEDVLAGVTTPWLNFTLLKEERKNKWRGHQDRSRLLLQVGHNENMHR